MNVKMQGTITFTYEADDTSYDSQKPSDMAREDEDSLQSGLFSIDEFLEMCENIKVSIKPAPRIYVD